MVNNLKQAPLANRAAPPLRLRPQVQSNNLYPLPGPSVAERLLLATALILLTYRFFVSYLFHFKLLSVVNFRGYLISSLVELFVVFLIPLTLSFLSQPHSDLHFFEKPRWKRFYLLAVLQSLFLLFPLFLVNGIILGVAPNFLFDLLREIGLNLVSENRLAFIVLRIFVLTFIPVITFDLYFRALVLRSLLQNSGTLVAVLITALFEAMMMNSPALFLPILVASISSSYLFINSQSLWPSLISQTLFRGALAFLLPRYEELGRLTEEYLWRFTGLQQFLPYILIAFLCLCLLIPVWSFSGPTKNSAFLHSEEIIRRHGFKLSFRIRIILALVLTFVTMILFRK